VARPPSASAAAYLLAVVVIGASVAVFLYPALSGRRTFSAVENLQEHSYPWFDGTPHVPFFPQVDQADYVHPRQVFVDRSLEVDGRFPLWNPMMFGGHAFFAENGSRLAYPPFVLLAGLFDPTWAHDLYVAVHLLAAGIATFALMRALRVGTGGSLLAGVAWALSSYALGWIQLEMFAAPAALLPLALLCVRRWHDRASVTALLAGALALGFLFLGSTVELALLSFLCVGTYAASLAVARLMRQWRDLTMGRRLAIVAGPAVLVLGAVAVASVGLLPFLDLLGRSERAAGSSLRRAPPGVPVANFRWAVAPPPVPKGSIWAAAKVLVSGTVFVGTATVLLAVVGLFRRRPGSGLGRGLVVVLFLFTIGSPVTWAALHVVPRLSALDGRGRALFLWDLGVAMLGGLGLDALLGWIRARPGPPVARHEGRTERVLAASLAAACIAVTGAQLIVHGRRVNPPFPRREAAHLFPSTPAIEAVRSTLGPSLGQARVLAVTNAAGVLVVPGDVSMALALPEAGGYETVLPATVSKLWRVVAGEPETSVLANGLPGTFVPAFPASSLRTDLLARTGVAALLGPPEMGREPGWDPPALVARGLRQAYSGPDGTVYEVSGRVPRATVVTDARWVGSSTEAFRRFVDPAFDVRRQVVLQGEPSVPSGPPSAVPPGSATVEWREDRPDRLRLGVTAPAPGWLVVLDGWDQGWRATVNGRSTGVRLADYNFRAVRVPAGSSTVRFSYHPKPVTVGAVLSAVAVTAIVAVIVVVSLGRRRRAGRASSRDAAGRGPPAAGSGPG
jgi:uncharacterized membrane protein YhaH (DUF805 family)